MIRIVGYIYPTILNTLPLVKSLGFGQLVASTTRAVGRYKGGIFLKITCNIGRYTCNLERFKVIARQSVDCNNYKFMLMPKH